MRGPVLAEVVRSGFVEGCHRGALVALDRDGSPAFAAGDPHWVIFPRSANKPLQAAGMLRAGLELDGELLAVAAGSHAGEDFHLAAVGRILAGAGLDRSALQAAPRLPGDAEAMRRHLRAGGQEEAILADCSGKHAAMLATCVARGWPTDTYLDPDHPLQRALAATVCELAGEQIAAVGVDGCGAPLFALSLTGLARAYRAHVLGPDGSAERRVADAMRAHPEYVGGTRRGETALMRAVPGALAKPGAEAAYAVALPDGRAFALKIEDGNPRACGPVVAEALRRFGVDHPVLAELADEPVHGGGRVVGGVRARPLSP